MSYSRHRVRERGSFIPSNATLSNWARYRNCGELNWVNLGAYTSCSTGEVLRTEDVVVSNFRRRQARGEVFFNPFFQTRTASYIDVPGDGPAFQSTQNSCFNPVLKQEGRLDGAWFARLIVNATNGIVPVDLSIIPQNEVDRLVTEVSTKCLAMRGQASNNLFESAAEYKQTLSMFQKPIRSFNGYLNSQLAGKKKFRFGRIDPAGTWLMLRYGLVPFIRDITGIVKGLKQPTGHRRETSRASGEIQRSASSSHLVTNAWGSGVYNVTYQKETIDSVKVRAMSLDEYIATAASNIGFTTKGLIGVPWELVTYSFVVDWFVNVGDYLYALMPAPGYKQLGSCLTIARDVQTVYSPVSTTASGTNVITRGTSGSVRGWQKSKIRRPLAPAGLVVKNDFRMGLSGPRPYDALALVAKRIAAILAR